MVHSWHVTFHFLGPVIVITIILAGEKDMGNVVDFGCWNSQSPSKSGAPPPRQGLVELVGDLQSSVFLSLFSFRLLGRDISIIDIDITRIA